MLAQVADVIELGGLQVGARHGNFRDGRLGQDVLRDILDRLVDDFMDEADIPLFTGGDAPDHLAPGDFGIDHGLATTPAILDHDDKILHREAGESTSNVSSIIYEKQKMSRRDFLKHGSFRAHWTRITILSNPFV
jgi:hypothetical protein